MFTYTGKMRSRYIASDSIITLETLDGESVTMPSPFVVSNGYITFTVTSAGKYRVRVRTPTSHYSYQIEVTAPAAQVTPSLTPKAVAVANGNEFRPVGSDIVMWIGGTQKPLNMSEGDLWFALPSTTPPPEPDPTPTPTGTTHSIWGSAPYPYAAAKDTGSPITVANGFYSYGTSPDVSAWRVVGAKVWIPTGEAVAGPLAIKLWFGSDAQLEDTPDRTTTINAPVSGWNLAYFATPVETNAADQIYIGYRFPGGEYVGAPSPGGNFVPATDGSHIVLAAETERRSLFKYDAGATTDSAAVYGIDIIYDEGP